jgi:hypothetical protein
MRGRRWVAAALALVIGLAGTGALMLAAGAVRTVTAPDRYSQWRGHQFDVEIQQQHGAPALRALEGLPSADRVEAITFVFGQVAARSAEPPENELVFVGDQGPLGTRLTRGRLPDPDHPEQFVATEALVKELHAHLGQRFSLRSLSQAQADANGFTEPPKGASLTVVLVGVIDGPSDLNDGYEVVLFPRTLLQRGDIGTSGTVAEVALTPGATMADLRREVTKLPNAELFSVRRTELVSPETRSAVNAQGQAVVILTVIVLLTAVVVLGQLLGRQLAMGSEERTALQAAGYSRAQLILDPVARAGVPIVAGVIGAGVAAYLCSGAFPIGFVSKVEPHPGRRFDAIVHLAGPLLLALALLSWVIATLLLAARARPPAARASVVERLASGLPALQISTALRFAFAPAGRRTRSATTQLVGLGLLLVLFVGALTFGSNFDRLVQRPDAYGDNFDAAIGAGADHVPKELIAAIEGNRTVTAVTLFGTSTVTAGTQSTDLVGMEPRRGGLRPTVLTGRLPVGQDEVALGPVLARQLHVAAGDRLALRAGRRHRIAEVTGTVLVPPINGADVLGKAALVDAEGFRALAPREQMTVLALDVRAGTPRPVLARLLASAGAGDGRLSPPAAIVNLRRVRSVPYLVAAAVGLLAVLDLAHLTIMAVRRRRRDLAVLRALGTTPSWLRSTVHWQTTLAVLAVLVPSIPLGVAAGRSIYERFMTDLGARTGLVVPLGHLGLAAVAAVVVANIVAALPARRGGRVPATVLAATA